MPRCFLLFIPILTLFAGAQVSCIVTNQIDFEDEVNSPLTVISFSPVEPIQTIEVDADDDVAFTILVWDPDIMDESNMRARLYISRESDSEDTPHQVRNCEPTAAQEPLSTEGIDESYTQNGTLAEVTCSDNPYYIVLDSPPGTLVSVRMEVSDLGYTGDVPTEGAYTVDIMWLFRVVD
jgi:hypothetical protein